ncbi:hypothetical protein BDI24065_00068 [Burkholderia diffusa]|uniref:Uncharacterized protein n=1 Tax=Burkholderia diffusa TaxID=488732 RepID=A0A6P2GNE8_9BURK|nr:hypothetical protein BDI24065_00068 [Burkholderia diffusa]
MRPWLAVRMTRTGKKSRTGILADPPGRLTRAAANSAYLGSRTAVNTFPQRNNRCSPAAGTRWAGTEIRQKISRSTVKTSIPTMIVPSMLRRHKNQPRPASAA